MAAPEAPFMRFLRSYRINEETGCWLWQSSKYQNGYGWLKVFGKVVSAHRFSYELHRGKIPDGMEILHSCDVRCCVNPAHLRVGTHAENMAEAYERGRFKSGKQHYLYGRKNPRPTQANKVLVLGKEYASQKEAERSLSLGSGTVGYWIKNRPDKAQIISRITANG